MKKFYCVLFSLVVLISGCSSAPKYTISPEWDKSKLAKVHVYRTNVAFHSLNPEKPFFYIDDKRIGKLGTGQAISIDVLPGKHTITVKASLLFMPSFETGKLELEAEENKEYYVRYPKDFSGVSKISSTNFVVTGESSIQLVNKEYYLNRM